MGEKKDNIDNVYTFHYTFTFSDGRVKEFEVKLDKRTLALITAKKSTSHKWAELTFCQCPHCPFIPVQHKYCPIAINLEELIEFFRDAISFEEVDVSIESEARKYVKHTSLQKGVSSLLGIYMVTSGCPVMEKLKPMVRFHLPFASPEETIYRAISMYLFAQYFLHRRGKIPDWDLKNLLKIYDDVKIVNKSFSERLSSFTKQDASVNALAILHNFANYVTFSIDENMLHRIELLFNSYFDDQT